MISRMASGEFSVYWWGSDGSQYTELRFVDVETAMVKALDLPKRPFSHVFGMLERVIVTDGGDSTCFEWLKGKGVVFPPNPLVAKRDEPELPEELPADVEDRPLAEVLASPELFKKFFGEVKESKKYDKDHLTDAHEDLKKRGMEREWYVRVPEPNEVFLDLDTPEQQVSFEAIWPSVEKMFAGSTRAFTDSRTPGCKHAIVTLTVHLSDAERIALQAICGSSPLRELLCLVRVLGGIENPSVLYERKPMT